MQECVKPEKKGRWLDLPDVICLFLRVIMEG